MRWTADSERLALERLRLEHPTVLIYTRQSKSDFDQEGNPRGPSLEQQRADCARLPELAGCKVEHFQDADRSGRETSKRPGYLAMMSRIDMARPSEVGAVVVYEGSRLHRNALAFFKLMAHLEEHGILVLDVKREIRNADRLGWRMRAIFFEDERDRLADRVTANLAHLKRQGKSLGHAQFGYHHDTVTKSKVITPELVETVKHVFTLRASGLSLRGLTQRLNDEKMSARHWDVDHLKGMLQDPIYIGKPKGVGVECPELAIIDEALFDKCQHVRVLMRKKRTNFKGRKNPYSLVGLVSCGRCGSSMHGHTRRWKVNGEERSTAFYRCSNHYVTGTCDHLPVKALEVEEVVRQSLAYCTQPGAVDPAARRRLEAGLWTAPDPKKAIRARLASLEAQAGRVLEMRQDNLITREEAQSRIGDINAKKVAAREELAQAPQADVAWCRERLGSLIEVWEHADAAQRHSLLSEVLEDITIDQTSFGLVVTLVPRSTWKPFFRQMVGAAKGQPEIPEGWRKVADVFAASGVGLSASRTSAAQTSTRKVRVRFALGEVA